MKAYVKPEAELVDLRFEERLATGECPIDGHDPDGYEIDPGSPDEMTPGCTGVVYGTTPS